MKKGLIFCLLVFILHSSFAQKYEYHVHFEGIGDNREFFSRKAHSQTILGSRLALEAGTNLDGHRFKIGFSELYEFGSSLDYHQPKLTLYYHYHDKQKSFYFG